MSTTAALAWVADIYDDYVTSTVDIPFFTDEATRADGPVLELMVGTGRVSLPLARAGVDLTCVDLSGAMLDRLRAKLNAEGLQASVHEANVTSLDLPDRDFVLALLPFQAFGELLSDDDQQRALRTVASHLRPGGRFICTLHNPTARRGSIDGQLRLLGSFQLSNRGETLLLWSHQQLEPDGSTVRAMQLYEIYDSDGQMIEKRKLDVRFRLIDADSFEALVAAAGFEVDDVYGDYSRSPFQPDSSPFMIWMLRLGTS